MNQPVIPERRKPLTRKQRLDAHDRHGGTCCVCLGHIPAGAPFIDEHIIPLALGGSNDAGNRGIAHIDCAKIKTRRDAAAIAKTVRMRCKQVGIKRRISRPMPGSKASGLKKKLNGQVERR